MKHINIIELGNLIISKSSRLVMYSYQWNLIRVVDQNLLSHPHTLLYSNLILFSNAPFIRIYGDKAKVYSIVQGRKDSDIQLDMKKYDRILTYTDDSCILLPTRGDKAKILQFRDDGSVNEYVTERPSHILPQGRYSYVVYGQGILAIAKDPTTLDEITRCKRIFHRGSGYYEVLQCVASDENFFIVSDGLYGYSLEHRKSGFVVENAIMDLNTIVLTSSKNSLLIRFSSKGEKGHVYEVPLVLDGAIFIDDDAFLGKVGDKLILYNLNGASPKILATIDKRTSMYSDALHGYIALKKDGIVELIDLNNNSLTSIRASVKDIILIDSKLILLNRNRIIVYDIESTDKKIRLEKQLDSPTTLVHCIAANNSAILCIDVLGRFVKLDARHLLDYKPKIYAVRSDKGTSIILNSFTPGYPIKFWPSNNLRFESKRLNTYSTLISIKDGLRDKTILTVSTNGVIDSSEKSLKIGAEKREWLIKKALDLDSVAILNGVPLVCDEGLRNSIAKCLSKLVPQESHENMMLTCFVNETQTADYLEQYQAVFINSVRFAAIAPKIDFEANSICIDKHQIDYLKDIDIGLEVLCNDKLYTIDENCRELNLDNCNYIKMLIYAKLVKDKCIVEVPIRHNVEIRTKLYEGTTAIMRRGLRYSLLIPAKCYNIVSSDIVYSDGPMLEVTIANNCKNIALTILSEQSVIVPPETEKTLRDLLTIDDIIRGYKELAIIEPSNTKLVLFPIELGSLLSLANHIALKVSAVIGLRRWLERP